MAQRARERKPGQCMLRNADYRLAKSETASLAMNRDSHARIDNYLYACTISLGVPSMQSAIDNT